jgi:hypothetical protein
VNIKTVLLKNKLFFLLFFLTITFNIIIVQFPLFKDFSYEFAAVNALLFFFTIPILIFHYNKKKKEKSERVNHTLALVLSPIVVIILGLIFNDVCSLLDGFIFFLIISFISGLIAYFLTEIAYNISSKFGYIIYGIFLFYLIITPLIELYFQPQIYFYSPLIGFFPGSFYDEDINIDQTLVLYRFFNIVSILLIYKLSLVKIEKQKIILIFSFISLLILSHYLSPVLGFSTTESVLQKVLNEKIVGNNFEIYSTRLDSLERQNIALHLNYYMTELQKDTKLNLSKKIKVFLFSNAHQKKKYFGSENADVAKPWLYHIYLDRESWKETLKHELAHLFSSEFAEQPLKLAGDLNPFLIEGFATAKDPYFDNISIDYLAATHYAFSRTELLQSICKGFNFFSFNSTLSYIYSGSFTKYLINKFGLEKFKHYYRTNNFESVYHKNFAEVVNDYYGFLSNIKIDTNQHHYNYYFGRNSLIQKKCPRYVEKKVKQAWKLLSENENDLAKIKFAEVLEFNNNYSALVGLTECLIKEDSLQKALYIIIHNLDKFNGTPYEYLLKFRLADIYSMLNNYEKAQEIYALIENYNCEMSLSILSNLRLELIKKGKLREYLLGNDSLKVIILSELNREGYIYSSIPSLIKLAKSFKIQYEEFIKFFNRPFVDFDNYSSEALYRLSEYMIDNQDFQRARKMAALSRRLNKELRYEEFFENHFKKTEWFYINFSKN